jgi:hypothetical protein
MKYRILSATLLGLATSVLPLGAAVAYIGDNPYIVRLSAPREVGCDEPVTITAKVRSSDTSDPAVAQIVLWDLKKFPSPDDVVTPAQTVTDSEGRTSAVLTFGQVDGERTVRVEIATWPTTIRVTCVGALSAASPSPSASATAVPTVAPSATPSAAPTAPPSPSPAPSPDNGVSTDSGSLTAFALPVALGFAIVLGLGALLLVARRR